MKLLFLLHSHPQLQAGGTEIFSRDLFRSLKTSGHDGIYLAGTSTHQRQQNPGTAFQTVGNGSDDMLMWTGGFDPFNLAQVDNYGVAPALRELLSQLKPDIVHFHHLLTLGVETVGLVRRFAPDAQVVFTLHDYYPICANDGQMVTTAGGLCSQSGLDACHRCFPDRSVTDFRLRDLHIRGALEQVDHFIAPSDFLRRRYMEWGLPERRISVIQNGLPQTSTSLPRRDRPRRDRFGFFGHLNRFKGATVALEASSILTRRGIEHSLTLHGDSAYQSNETIARLRDLSEQAPAARRNGPYRRSDLTQLLSRVDWVLFPSVWWENAPLVISEALQHGLPVICSDIGGAAELIGHRTNGLHFAVGDPRALAEAMELAVNEEGLWDSLVSQIATPLSIEECASRHSELYSELAARRVKGLAA